MLQVDRLYLQVTKDRHYFSYWQLLCRLQNVKQARYVLLDVKRHMKRLECKVFNSPDVSHMLVGDLFKLLNVVQKFVHVAYALIEHHLRVVH